jgi:hypothetical protein
VLFKILVGNGCCCLSGVTTPLVTWATTSVGDSKVVVVLAAAAAAASGGGDEDVVVATTSGIPFNPIHDSIRFRVSSVVTFSLFCADVLGRTYRCCCCWCGLAEETSSWQFATGNCRSSMLRRTAWGVSRVDMICNGQRGNVFSEITIQLVYCFYGILGLDLAMILTKRVGIGRVGAKKVRFKDVL